MPISSGDILIKYSVKSATSGNADVGTAATSLGRFISKTTITDNVLNNLYDDVSGIENQGLESEYRSVFIHNNHATLTWLSPVVWISGSGGGTTLAIAIDNSGASLLNSATAQGGETANEDTPPSNTGAFSSPLTSGAGLSLGNLSGGYVRQVWVKRTTINGAAMNSDYLVLAIAGDTNA